MKPWQAALNETPSQGGNESTKREREDPKSKLEKANPKMGHKEGAKKS